MRWERLEARALEEGDQYRKKDQSERREASRAEMAEKGVAESVNKGH